MRSLNLEFFAYCRPFSTPLRTAHGLWSERAGLIVKITEGNRTGWGEVAPLPWFGTESFDKAMECLAALTGAIAVEDLWDVSERYPCCQFAIGSALWMLEDAEVQNRVIDLDTSNVLPGFSAANLSAQRVAGLMPAGAGALDKWQGLYDQGHRTLKWKVTGDLQELDIFEQLLESLPDGVALRLDANGGLSRSQAEDWLARCDRLPPGWVEYFEQPLPPEDFDGLQRLRETFSTMLALDESVATVGQLQRVAAKGWDGTVVVKPAIAGYPQYFFSGHLGHLGGLRIATPDNSREPAAQQPWLEKFSGVVFSSVFETPIGQWGALKLAAMLGSQDRALGFGTDAWLAPVTEVKLKKVVR
ncbi:MAG: o-succinylbenzoate synthase [Cyanobacteria bacterium P01_C01_bin.89]